MSRTSQQRFDRREAALVVAREALPQIARDRASARPTAYFRAKAQFALDRIETIMNTRADDVGKFAPLTAAEDAADSLLSYNAAVAAIGERVKAGAPPPEFMLSRKAPP